MKRLALVLGLATLLAAWAVSQAAPGSDPRSGNEESLVGIGGECHVDSRVIRPGGSTRPCGPGRCHRIQPFRPAHFVVPAGSSIFFLRLPLARLHALGH